MPCPSATTFSAHLPSHAQFHPIANMITTPIPHKRVALVGAVAAAFAASSQAQSVFITNAGSGLSWGTSANWTPSGIPNSAGAAVQFNSPVGNQTVSLGLTRLVGSLTVTNNSEFNWGISSTAASSVLTFDNGESSASLTVNGTTTTAVTIPSYVALNSNLVLNVTNTNATDNRGALSLSGVISGEGRITKTGNGTASIAGATNTFTGGLTINEGTIRVTGASGVGAAPASPVADQVIINGGRLQMDGTSNATPGNTVGFQLGANNAEIAVTNTGTYTINGTISGTGQLRKTGTGTLNIANGNTTANTYSGGTIVEEGVLQLGRSGSLGTGAVQLGIVGGGNAAIIANLSGWTYNNNITVVSGAIGTLQLGGSTSNNNTYSGAITVNGPLEITSATTSGNATRFTGILSGSGNITKIGSGEWRVENANNTWNGNLTISEGSVNLLEDASLRFTLGNEGATNSISGTGTAKFDGVFVIDRSAVTADTGTWQLIAVDTLSETFGTSFTLRFLDGVTTFTDLGGGLFELGDWSFNTTSGLLSLTASPIPEPSAFAALAGLGALVLVSQRRRRA